MFVIIHGKPSKKTEYGHAAIQTYYKSFYVIIVSWRMITEKFCNKRHNNGTKFFALYNNKKGEEKKASCRCVSNTGIVKFLQRAEGKWFVQID